MKSTYRIIATALAATSVLAATAQAMPARDVGHWTEQSTAAVCAASCNAQPQLPASVVIPRRGPLAI